ncbi:MAG: methionyl-tRNA formyltransferase [Syntrophomonadaceae bacterium]|nr:methionyl-tRNA formyltransferase [Syntrophomonadaceae bacterium]
MKIIFMGTSEFAVPSLQAIINNGYEILGVVTQPDRPRGRGHKLQPTPIKVYAQTCDLPIMQFNKIKSQEAIEWFQVLQPEIVVVVSYGQIIPAEIINLPEYGCINVHASLLPEYRGAAPIQRAIMDGKTRTGTTIMYMNEGLDTGDIIMQTAVDIGIDMTHGELESILAKQGADLLIKALPAIKSGNISRVRQDDTLASYAAMIKPEDETLDWKQDAWSLHNRIRALSPQPGCYTVYQDEKLKIFKSRMISADGTGTPGLVFSATKEGFIVETGLGTIEILELQKAGRKRMSARDFMNGGNIKPGVLMGCQGE